MRTEIQNMRMELSTISMMDEFARYARLERKINKMTDQLKTLGKQNIMKLWFCAFFIGVCASHACAARWSDKLIAFWPAQHSKKPTKMPDCVAIRVILIFWKRGAKGSKCEDVYSRQNTWWKFPKSLVCVIAVVLFIVGRELRNQRFLHLAEVSGPVWKMAGGFHITAPVFMKTNGSAAACCCPSCLV